MEVIEECEILHKIKIDTTHRGIELLGDGSYFMYDMIQVLRHGYRRDHVVNVTGWAPMSDFYIFHNAPKTLWFIEGCKSTPIEVFELLSDEDKEKALWELDEWMNL